MKKLLLPCLMLPLMTACGVKAYCPTCELLTDWKLNDGELNVISRENKEKMLLQKEWYRENCGGKSR